MAIVEAGKPSEAWPYFELAVSRPPENVITRLSYGQSLWQAGRQEEAAVQFRRVAELNPDSADASYSRGLIAIYERRYDEARHQLEAALRDGSSLSDRKFLLSANDALGNMFTDQRKPAEAIHYYGEAGRLAPTNVHALNKLSAALLANGDAELAMEQINKTLQLAPDSAEGARAYAVPPNNKLASRNG